MRNLRIFAALMLLAGLAIAQDVTRDPSRPLDPSANQARDLFSAARSDDSLSMFVTAVQSSGMAKMLREEGPLTVFALSNRAFANLPKKDLEALLSNHAAMHILIAHYIAHGNIPQGDTEELLSARTLVGVKLRTDVRDEGYYVNGAKLNQIEIPCANGAIYVLDRFDPGLIHDALALATRTKN
jgi:uncharacterized surface protein with fasciclin (FAS1) repeats